MFFLGGATYQLIKTAAGDLLLKKVKPSPGQIDLFSGAVYEPKKLKPKAAPEQMGLFDGGDTSGLISLSTLKPKTMPKVDGKGRKRAPKGGGHFTNPATGETKFFEGGKFIPAEFSAEAPNPTATPNLFDFFNNSVESAQPATIAPVVEPEDSIADSGAVIDSGTTEPAAPEPETPARKIQPFKAQKGGPEKNVGKLLNDLGIASDVLAGEDYHRRIHNGGYLPLVVERHDDQLFLSHYISQGGDLITDSEMVFQIGSEGHLALREITYRGPFGPVRVNAREGKSFAAMFSKNLIDQGFNKANLDDGPEPEASIVEPEELAVKPMTEPLGEAIDYKLVRGKKTRGAANRAAADLVANQDSFTDDEKALLSKYSGRGGLGGDDVSLNEYYTRPDIAKFAIDILYQHGFKGGTMVEPSCGAGVFLSQGDRPGLKMIGCEVDATSSKIARALNPHAEVVGDRFERFCLNNAETKVDAIVGNAPFGVRMTTKDFEANKYKSQWKRNEDLFMDASMDMLAPGGMMSMIVPYGVVSGGDHQAVRESLALKGRVIGVYRLPESAFKHSDTQVVTDTVVMQKHPQHILDAIARGDQAVIDAVSDPGFTSGSYFDNHPQNVLGAVGTKRRGDREMLSVKGDLGPEELAAAPAFAAPAVDYAGITGGMPDRELQVGDEKSINGKRHRLNANHRWELVDEVEAIAAADFDNADPSAYGADSIDAAEAMVRDIGQRVNIPANRLGAFADLAGDLPTYEALRDAKIAAGKVDDDQAPKIAHAMILAEHIEYLQKHGGDDQALEQALNLLQEYREKYGNPHDDRDLSKLALVHTKLLKLQGAFDGDGKISDYFSDNEAVTRSIERTQQSSLFGAVGEAFRGNSSEGVSLDMVRDFYPTEATDPDLMAELLSDPTIGYSNGLFGPAESLLQGNGLELMAEFESQRSALAEQGLENSPQYRKLSEQIESVGGMMQYRSIDDMTIPLRAVGKWLDVEILNEFARDRNDNQFEWNEREGKFRIKQTKAWVSRGEEDVLNTINGDRLNRGSKTPDAKAEVAEYAEEFKQWIAASEHRLGVEEAYNAAYNSDIVGEYSGEALSIPGIEQTDTKKLHHFQNSTIRQMADRGRGIIALGVGLGKTATAIALSQHLKNLGRTKKPTVVVPKSVLANWFREASFWGDNLNVLVVGMSQQFWGDGSPAWEVPGMAFKTKGGNPLMVNGKYQLYRTDDPNKAIVTMTEEEVQKRGNLAFKDDDAATKQKKLQQLAQNSYDLVLMSEPVFQSIPLTPDREYDNYQEIMGRHISDSSAGNKKKGYELEKRKQTFMAKLSDRRGDKSEITYWEDLGVDAIFHDEAHHLKNLFGVMRSGDIAFLNTPESNRSLDFYNKAKYTREQNNGQNVYLLTATPTTNNPLEAFNMLQHVAPEEFDKRGIENIDDFLEMFGKIESVMVPGVDLEMTTKNGLTGFKNLKDLRSLFGKFTRMQSAKEVGLVIPEEAARDVQVDMTPAQAEVYEGLRQRADDLLSGKTKDDEDHIFSVISDMDKAAIDLEYYNATTTTGEPADLDTPESRRSPKIEASVKQIMQSRGQSSGKQIMFCDAVQLHEKLKAQLVAAGYPENEIQIVNAKTVPKSSDRQKISQAYNDGRISLVIGNTATMGEGMNFQVGTTDIHHLTTPWTPAAIEQRNGRGVRQGNKADEVNIHYYAANKTFDLYRKGVLERKRGWIDDLWKGDSDTADNKNTGSIGADEMAVMMAADPEAARKAMNANRELQMQRLAASKGKDALKRFGQLQTMQAAFSKTQDQESPKARQLQARIDSTVAALRRDEHFPHKDLLDGAPAYIGPKGDVARQNGYITGSSGEVYRITNIDPAKRSMDLIPVLGGSYRPFSFDANESKTIKFGDMEKRYESIGMDDRVLTQRRIAAVDSYTSLRHLTQDEMDGNRDALTQSLRKGYSKTPIETSTGEVKFVRGDEIGDGDRVLFPGDAGVIDKAVGAIAKAHDSEYSDYQYREAMEQMTGQSWFSEIHPKIKAMRAASAPKEGDTKTDNGVGYVLRGGRWPRSEDAVSVTSAQSVTMKLVHDVAEWRGVTARTGGIPLFEDAAARYKKEYTSETLLAQMLSSAARRMIFADVENSFAQNEAVAEFVKRYLAAPDAASQPPGTSATTPSATAAPVSTSPEAPSTPNQENFKTAIERALESVRADGMKVGVAPAIVDLFARRMADYIELSGMEGLEEEFQTLVHKAGTAGRMTPLGAMNVDTLWNRLQSELAPQAEEPKPSPVKDTDPTPSPPPKPASREEFAESIVDRINSLGRPITPKVWAKNGRVRIYLNKPNSRDSYGYIDVPALGKLGAETKLGAEHPIMEIIREHGGFSLEKAAAPKFLYVLGDAKYVFRDGALHRYAV
jgi:SNF2 family DNA or RNA helicase